MLSAGRHLSPPAVQHRLKIRETRPIRDPPSKETFLCRLVTVDDQGNVLRSMSISPTNLPQPTPPSSLNAQTLMLALMRKGRRPDEFARRLLTWDCQRPDQVVVTHCHPDKQWEAFGMREHIDFAPGELSSGHHDGAISTTPQAYEDGASRSKNRRQGRPARSSLRASAGETARTHAQDTGVTVSALLEMGLTVGPGMIDVIAPYPRTALLAISWLLRHPWILSTTGVESLVITFAGASKRLSSDDYRHAVVRALAFILGAPLPQEVVNDRDTFADFLRIVNGTLRFEKFPGVLYPPGCDQEALRQDAYAFFAIKKTSKF